MSDRNLVGLDGRTRDEDGEIRMSGALSIETAFNSLEKKAAWGLVRTHGSMFFLEIGQALPQGSRRNIRGEWHFLIEMCHWRSATQEAIIVGSEDNQEIIDRVFNEVKLGRLDKATTSNPGNDLHLLFSSGVILSTFTTSASATDQWTQWRLFSPDDNVWVVNGGGHLISMNAREARA